MEILNDVLVAVFTLKIYSKEIATAGLILTSIGATLYLTTRDIQVP